MRDETGRGPLEPVDFSTRTPPGATSGKICAEFANAAEHATAQFQAALAAFLKKQSMTEINDIQAMILYRMPPENRGISVGEFSTRQIYSGRNVSYNLKQLREKGFLERVDTSADRRTAFLRFTRKSQKIRTIVGDFFEEYSKLGAKKDGFSESLSGATRTLESSVRLSRRMTDRVGS